MQNFHISNLKGTGIAIVTPFTASHDIDYNTLSALIEYWIKGKADYLVVMGTTGESVTLSKSEKTDLFNFVAEKVSGRMPVVLGLGGNNTLNLIDQLQDFDLQKATAILSVSPYYNKPTQEGIYQHYKAFANESPLPVIVYNVPGRTGSNILPETTLRMAGDIEKIAGVKEASGNMEQIMQIISRRRPDFLVLSGDDAITLPLMAAGADGVISVVANAFPFEFSEMVRLAADNKLQEARQYHYRLLTLIQYLFVEGNPAGIKAVMHLKSLCEPHLRLPLTPVSETLIQKIKKVID
ncbi:MAG: 4-hydroxy-tetrahydrodipicolinate synthase [Candidatus Competibacteraceae bacterium]|nr:4-hydroxy-tetrahydrodipicolinate synthase [Candidatus Competibacteraceae bacterium]